MSQDNLEVSHQDLVTKCCGFLDEMKAREIEVVPLEGHSLFDDFIIATCTSSRHLKSTAEQVLIDCKKELKIFGRIESSESWVALDLGTLVVHLFLEDVRHLYDLESLWSLVNDQSPAIERENQWETKKPWDL